MFCHRCGKQNGEDSKHCVECGANLDQSPIAVIEEKRIKKGTIKSWLKKAVLFISVFILSLIIVKVADDSYYYDDGENVLPALAISIIIVFVWSRIAKRFSL